MSKPPFFIQWWKTKHSSNFVFISNCIAPKQFFIWFVIKYFVNRALTWFYFLPFVWNEKSVNDDFPHFCDFDWKTCQFQHDFTCNSNWNENLRHKQIWSTIPNRYLPETLPYIGKPKNMNLIKLIDHFISTSF